MMYRTLLLISATAIAACGRSERAATADSARGDVTSAVDTGMAGMDHSKMPGMADTTAGVTGDTGAMAGMDHANMPGMAAPTGAAKGASKSGAMAGMDHSKMPGMAVPSRNATPNTKAMAGIDHANMPGMNRTSGAQSRGSTPRQAPMANMDHANMPGMRPTRAAASAPAQMDHANMPGMTMPATPPVTTADLKLDSLLNALLNDAVVRQRIQSDTSLKRRWDQAARRTILLDRPE